MKRTTNRSKGVKGCGCCPDCSGCGARPSSSSSFHGSLKILSLLLRARGLSLGTRKGTRTAPYQAQTRVRRTAISTV